MPIVRIDLIEGKSEEYRAQIGEIVYQTLGPILFWHLNEVDERILLAKLHSLMEAVRKFLVETLLPL